MEQFVLPVHYRGSTYTSCELRRIRGSVLAETERASGNMMGMVKFLSGCIESVHGDAGSLDTGKIEDFVRHMPYNNVEHMMMRAFLMRPEAEGAIEQITKCPRCKTEYVYEWISDEVDQRIKFDDLTVNYCDAAEAPAVSVTLSEPLEIASKKGEVLETISSITLQIPDMNACIAAEAMHRNNMVDMQYKMYAESITHVDDRPPDAAYRKTWGAYIFRKMYETDIKQVSDQINHWGIQKRMEHTCGNCGKQYSFPLDISGFFD